MRLETKPDRICIMGFDKEDAEGVLLSMKAKYVYFIVTVIVLSSLLSACSHSTSWKKQVTDALPKMNQMKNYKFSGTASVSIANASNDTAAKGAAAAILSALKNSTWSWSGIADVPSTHMEATVKVTPNQTKTPITIPILLQNNKFYFNVPFLSAKPDTYYVIDTKALSQSSGHADPLSAKTFQQLSEGASKTLQSLFQQIDAKWYSRKEEEINGNKYSTVSVKITDKNADAISAAMNAALPQFRNMLPKSIGLFGSGSEPIQLEAPGLLSVRINDQEMIDQETLDFTYSTKSAPSSKNHIRFEQSYSDIDQHPSFTMKVPTHAKSFNDILKYLK